MAVGPLSLPGGNPAKIGGGVKPLDDPALKTAGYKLPARVRPNRRLGARKASRMAFTPPGKIGAYGTIDDVGGDGETV